MKKILVLVMAAFCFLAYAGAQGKPEWIDDPIGYGRSEYEGKTRKDESKWSYVMGQSRLHATEKSARETARRSAREAITENIAATLTGNITNTEFFKGSENVKEQRAVKFESYVKESFSMRVPSIEFLESYVEGDETNGYRAYVFGRYLSKVLFGSVEKLDVDKAAEDAARKYENETGEKIPEEIVNQIKIEMREQKVEWIETHSF